MPTWNALSFQQSFNNLMEQADYFHDYALLIITLILTMLAIIFIDLLTATSAMTFLTEHTLLEVWWTILPGIVLIMLAVPSLQLLYFMDEISTPDLTILTLGHQWFWEYNYPDFNNLSFESYLAPTTQPHISRLLDVDNRVVVPFNCLARMLVTSTDVLHSWAMPSLGVKVDAVPGRLNQLSVSSWGPGLFYGQCSEICGANHSFMPIVLEMVNKKAFISWALLWE